MKTDSSTSLLDKPWFAVVVFSILTAVVIAAWWLVPTILAPDLRNLADRGVYGDSFGSINALFTGLAFSGVVFTILLQLRELRLQRADFLHQLEAMHQSRDEVEEQNNILRAQVEVQLLDTVTRAIELEAQADALAAAQWRPGTAQHNARVGAIQGGAGDIRKRVLDLQNKIIKKA